MSVYHHGDFLIEKTMRLEKSAEWKGGPEACEPFCRPTVEERIRRAIGRGKKMLRPLTRS